MMRFPFLIAIILLMPSLALSLPHQDGVVTVGERDFYVGELTDSFGEDAWSFSLRHAPWLKTLLDNDPMLSNYDVRFFRSGVPAIDLVDRTKSPSFERMTLEDDPQYMADNHVVFNIGDMDQYVYPKNSPLTYEVFCTRGGFSPGTLNLCDMIVVYPHGTNVALNARQYFPGALPEVSRNFELIAARMIEIATCLDITELHNAERLAREAELMDQNPSLIDCDSLHSS